MYPTNVILYALSPHIPERHHGRVCQRHLRSLDGATLVAIHPANLLALAHSVDELSTRTGFPIQMLEVQDSVYSPDGRGMIFAPPYLCWN